MNTITHKITHKLQPTTSSCGYTALSMLLSYYKKDISVEKLLEEVPQPLHEDGKPAGSVTAQLVTWCLHNGMKTKLWVSDTQITDLSWVGLSRIDIMQRLKAIENTRDVAAIGGKHWSRIYIRAYIEMLEAGGELEVLPYIGTELLYERLKLAPIFVNVSDNILNKQGRTRDSEAQTHTSIKDDINGRTVTHSVVIYGNEENGNFLVADPWEGLRTVEPEHMVLSIAGAQIECDNQIFQIIGIEK